MCCVPLQTNQDLKDNTRFTHWQWFSAQKTQLQEKVDRCFSLFLYPFQCRHVGWHLGVQNTWAHFPNGNLLTIKCTTLDQSSEPWSKEAHYIGNRVQFGTDPLSETETGGIFWQPSSSVPVVSCSQPPSLKWAITVSQWRGICPFEALRSLNLMICFKPVFERDFTLSYWPKEAQRSHLVQGHEREG